MRSVNPHCMPAKSYRAEAWPAAWSVQEVEFTQCPQNCYLVLRKALRVSHTRWRAIARMHLVAFGWCDQFGSHSFCYDVIRCERRLSTRERHACQFDLEPSICLTEAYPSH